MVGLERALVQYCSQPNDQPFDIKTVPIETAPSLAEGPRCKGNKINYLDGDLFPISKGMVVKYQILISPPVEPKIDDIAFSSFH